MPAQFDQPGLRFAYPDNWRIDARQARGDARMVTVQAPGTAYWTVTVYPPQSNPTALVEAGVKAMREEYPELEVEDICENYADRTMEGCDMHFHYLDLTNTASIRWFREQGRLYLLFWQAEDREYDAHEAVFEAMTVSLLRGLGSSREIVNLANKRA